MKIFGMRQNADVCGLAIVDCLVGMPVHCYAIHMIRSTSQLNALKIATNLFVSENIGAMSDAILAKNAVNVKRL